MTLQEPAWKSGLVLSDETAEWKEEDWPPLDGGWRMYHASVVLHHPNNDQAQTVAVMGGHRNVHDILNSVLLLDLSEPSKWWRKGPPMNKKRCKFAAVVCNGDVYVLGGHFSGDRISTNLNCIERMDVDHLLQSSARPEKKWTTLKCRLSTRRKGCSAVAVQNRYIVVMGGCNHRRQWGLSSVDIIDTINHTVIEGPSMNTPRKWCSSTVLGQDRIFVVGRSVEYWDFPKQPLGSKETTEETVAALISSSPGWTTHSDFVLSECRRFPYPVVVTVRSCLVVAGQGNTVDILDTYRNHVWNLPPLKQMRQNCSVVTVANQIAVISGSGYPSCETVSLMDRHTWCFRRLCEQQPNQWYHHRQEQSCIRDAKKTPGSRSTVACKRARTNT